MKQKRWKQRLVVKSSIRWAYAKKKFQLLLTAVYATSV